MIPITEHDHLIGELETAEAADPADIRDEIEIDLFTDLMAGGYYPYTPPGYTQRPSPPGSRYGIED